MFDQAAARPRSRVKAPVWTWVAAAGLACAAVLTWHLAGAPNVPRIGAPPITVAAPRTQQARGLDSASPVTAGDRPISTASTSIRSRGTRNADLRSDATAESTEFVAWPGAAAWPPFESGELIRVDIPTDAGVVHADVLVGQDGFARAIRLVQ